MILLIDNYDSFTYNLLQILAKVDGKVQMVRNDAISIEEIEAMQPDAIVISPGPGHPRDAGCCLELIKTFAPKIPILGVCLGHQAIGEAFGGSVVPAGEMMHGQSSPIHHVQAGVFEDIENPLHVARYHSLMVDRDSLPEELIIEAETENGIIMALRHREYPCYGLQFHPESILTPHGERLIENFFKIAYK